MNDVHELRRFVIMKLASCTSRLDLLDGAMQNYHIEAAHALVTWKALEKCVVMTEEILVHVRLQEIRADL